MDGEQLTAQLHRGERTHGRPGGDERQRTIYELARKGAVRMLFTEAHVIQITIEAFLLGLLLPQLAAMVVDIFRGLTGRGATDELDKGETV